MMNRATFIRVACRLLMKCSGQLRAVLTPLFGVYIATFKLTISKMRIYVPKIHGAKEQKKAPNVERLLSI